ncbi:hypothetical protein G5I_01596 [Acromyrmex echinatior]|uniref:Uncharacterized protein n=1 Tax=Acromyrmex echinatior TaxID=103372 RepID=F4W819_ACREC|nr:hypothetical protein G5I_01596 [Acromyrmex echinatior]
MRENVKRDPRAHRAATGTIVAQEQHARRRAVQGSSGHKAAVPCICTRDFVYPVCGLVITVELRRDESLASPRVRDTPSVISDEDYCANRVVICSDAVMGCSSRSFFLTTLLLVAGLLSIALFAEISCATRKSLLLYLWELS